MTTMFLFFVYIIIYSISMVVAETVPSIYNTPFIFIMVKYVFGTIHHSLVPLIIIITRKDLRDLIKVYFITTKTLSI